MKNILFLISLVLLFSKCKEAHSPTPKTTNLGTVELKATGSPEAATFFHDGLLLLHSFEFDDAAEKFVKAQEIDSTFVMAYWGEAMSYNHPPVSYTHLTLPTNREV